jgi:hypothetical protein
MIWVAWRQHRLQLLFGTAALALLLTFLLSTGFGISSTFHSTGLAACLAVAGRDCGDLSGAFSDRYTNLQFLVPLFLIIPALLGVFWGAPLVAREVEQGTYRLAWTQSVTRFRWLGTKLAVLVGATALGAGIFTWVLTWWSRPLVLASDDRLDPGIFDLRGVVPIAYALFALALGVAAGVLIRRVVPAMAATLAGYAATRGLVVLFVRPQYMAPRILTGSFFGLEPRMGLGDWILSRWTVDGAGHVLSSGHQLDFSVLASRCPGLTTIGIGPGQPPDKSAAAVCVQRIGLHVQDVYQPGSRFWAFQGIETGIFLAIAIGLLALSVYWVRRKIS